MRKNIKKVSDYDLLEYYKDAIMENHYNPTSDSYNKSGFSVDEIQEELFRRLNAAGEYEEDE